MTRALLVAVAVCCLAPSIAQAGTARADSLNVFYAADRGEHNRAVATAGDGFVLIVDPAGVTAGAACEQTASTRALCRPTAGIPIPPRTMLRLGDRDDRGRIDGGGGSLEGGAGDDRLSTVGLSGTGFVGGPGRDRMVGGPGVDGFGEGGVRSGTDTMLGRGGNDRVFYSDRRRGVSITLDRRRDDGARGERDLVLDVESAYGGRGDDLIAGNGRDNELQGGRGADVIRGGGGADRIHVGDPVRRTPARERDRAFGGRGDDRLEGVGGGLFIRRPRSLLNGGPGHDALIGGRVADARDGAADLVTCTGLAGDRALLDARDHASADQDRVCERIDRRAAAAAVPLVEPYDPRRATVSPDDGRVFAYAACPTDGPRVCRGTMRASLDGTPLGTLPFAVARGREEDLIFYVPPERRAELRLFQPRPFVLVATSRGRSPKRQVRRERYRAVRGAG